MRWLLNTFPSWVLAILMVGGSVLLALAGLRAIRRVDRGAADDFAGVMAGVIAAVYGVFLAFAIVALYEEFHEAEMSVQAESAALTRVVLATDRRDAALAYRDAVAGDEWDEMAEGRSSPAAWERLRELHAAAGEPGRRAVADLVDARRERLHAAEATLPSTAMMLLFGGGVLTLGFVVAFAGAASRVNAAMVVSFSVLLGFSLLVALLLDHPFSGDVAVSPEPLFEDALARR
ncbi:MAG: DUF4239 domain-containing protein [Actinomycetota bacterium]|nr:DUF4239 domain-containing protein [Actinomycetota bacterium]MDQ5808314.1 DUF4239 domain-containing protein [Actinomycetota bacterium]